MSEKQAELDVFLEGEPVGRLRLDEQRRFVFSYAREWLENPAAIPLSLALPMRREPYEDDAARPFFANLLPEGELRNLVARRLGLSPLNDFALLEEIGGECAGAVMLIPRGMRPRQTPGYRELGQGELAAIIEELPRKPLMAGERGIRLSLAGAQNKLPVYIREEKTFLPVGDSPSTHILKPPIPGFEESVQNEAFCMMLAERMGLPVPAVAIWKTPDPILIVERYDRRIASDGRVVRVHQEDFCQALGILPDQKYESEGGPSLSRCFGLLREKSTRPAADQKALLCWVIFNILIRNADAHAKNLSVLLAGEGPRIAPFYDLLCTEVYESLSKKCAMKIGGENRGDWIQQRHWERLADTLGFKSRFVLDTLRGMSEQITREAESLANVFCRRHKGVKIVGRIFELIQSRSSRFGF